MVVQLLDGSSRVVKHRSDTVAATADPNYSCAPFEVTNQRQRNNASLKLALQIPVVDSANSFLSIAAYSGDALLGFWCSRLERLRSGYRCVQLRDTSFRLINKGMCHVLCHLAIEE